MKKNISKEEHTMSVEKYLNAIGIDMEMMVEEMPNGFDLFQILSNNRDIENGEILTREESIATKNEEEE